VVCEHLRALEEALLAGGIPVTSRGQAWSKNCREWVYFDCVLDLAECRRRFGLEGCVEEHRHRGTHDGCEAGFVCTVHKDGVMGRHPAAHPGGRSFP